METTRFLTNYRIVDLIIGPDADIRDREISRVEVSFGTGEDDAPGYRVEFKLLDQSADAYRFLRRIGPPPECEAEWTDEGSALGAEARERCLKGLLGAISDRVDKVHKEQSILNIQPVGKTFVLMGKTRFEVLSDDGDGQLRIRLHRDEGTSEAGLNANDLLDGLYSGLITRA